MTEETSPTPKKGFQKIVDDGIRMLKAHSAPGEIALGIGIGAFIAVLPVYGFHTLLCVLAAILVRKANKLAILLGTNISLPFTVPIITWTGYDIGRFLLADEKYPPLSWEYLRHFQISKIHEFYYPLFIGSLVLGVICAVVLYGVTFLIVHYWKKRHLQEK